MVGVLEYAHQFIKNAVSEGDVAVDATVGNGHDTLFLAKQVGEEGKVYGFDIQTEAIESTEKRLTEAGVIDRVQLHHGSHEGMLTFLNAANESEIAAVMFNLGYLPGGDKTVITNPDSTKSALEQSMRLLRPGGRASVVVYRGHNGALAEARAVNNWASSLPQDEYQVARYEFINQANNPPYIIVVEKRHNAAQ